MRQTVFLPAVALVLSVSTAAAQSANPAPAAVGLGGNYTAVARGYPAVAWNPAALGLNTNPSASAVMLAARAGSGVGPITLGDLREWQDREVPAAVRQDWLSSVQRRGGQRGAAGLEMTWGGVHAGRFAGQVSTSGRGLNDVSPGVAQLLLMGNTDEDGNPVDIELGGSRVDANLYSSGALSAGFPVAQTAGWHIAAGLTARYTIGHGLALSDPSAGRTRAEPISAEFQLPIVYTPIVYNDENDYWIRSGGGFGFDVGVAAEYGRLTLGAVVENVLSTFEWDPDRLRYRAFALRFDDREFETSTEWQPLSEAPADLRRRVEDSDFRPGFRAGAAWRDGDLLIAGDAAFTGAGGLGIRPERHVGVGGEFRPMPWLHLQGGLAHVQVGDGRGGFQLGAGLGFQAGTFHLAVSAMRRNAGYGSETSVMTSLLSHTF